MASPTIFSAGIEYNHMFMQDRTYNFASTGVVLAPAGTLFATNRVRQDIDVVTARINYKFGVRPSRLLFCILTISISTAQSPGIVRGFLLRSRERLSLAPAMWTGHPGPAMHRFGSRAAPGRPGYRLEDRAGPWGR